MPPRPDPARAGQVRQHLEPVQALVPILSACSIDRTPLGEETTRLAADVSTPQGE